MTVFGVVLPTADSFGDILFTYTAFQTGNPKIACTIGFPVVLNVLFQIWKFFTQDFDGKLEKWLSWIFVILTVWPQYQALKLLGSILCGKSKEEWKRKKEKYLKELYFIEPCIESIPQYFGKLCVWITLAHDGSEEGAQARYIAASFGFVVIQGEVSQRLKDVFGEELCLPGRYLCIPNKIWFPVTMAITFVSSIYAIVEYLHNGPITTRCSKKSCCYGCSCCLLFSRLIYVLLSFWTKSIIITSYVTSAITSEESFEFITIGAIFFVFIPFFICMGPLARNLGLRNFLIFVMKNPQTIMTPVVTDFVYGPTEGYGSFKDCSCCCRCCCWYCCCFNKCKVETQYKVKISKQLSWARLAYSWLTAVTSWLLFSNFMASFRKNVLGFEGIRENSIFGVFYVLPGAMLVALLAFVIVLHGGEMTGEISSKMHEEQFGDNDLQKCSGQEEEEKIELDPFLQNNELKENENEVFNETDATFLSS